MNIQTTLFNSKTPKIVENKDGPWIEKYRPNTIEEIIFQS